MIWTFTGIAEASDLGFPVNIREWPTTVTVTLPNGEKATLNREFHGTQEAEYDLPGIAHLRVLND